MRIESEELQKAEKNGYSTRIEKKTLNNKKKHIKWLANFKIQNKSKHCYWIFPYLFNALLIQHQDIWRRNNTLKRGASTNDM